MRFKLRCGLAFRRGSWGKGDIKASAGFVLQEGDTLGPFLYSALLGSIEKETTVFTVEKLR